MAETKPHVLLVEDDQFMSSLLADGFAREGFDVALAGNGGDAVRLFGEKKPDVMVVDILLPGRNGLEALRSIRALPGGDGVPAIVLSNLEEANYIREAELLGIAAYLVKANMQIPDIVAKAKEAMRK